MRVAVVGTGIAGLGAAWLLQQAHEVTVFEAQARPGGHTHTVDAGDQPVDTGFIVYNEPAYPRLKALFQALRVATQASDMSFGVSVDHGRLEWAGDNWRSLFAQPSNLFRPSHTHMIVDILRFNRQTKRLLADDALPDQSLGAFLDEHAYGKPFRARYLLPMAAAIWSAPTASMLAFPLASFVRFFDNHGLLNVSDRPQWRTVTGGSREYVNRIIASLARPPRLETPVARVERRADGVAVIDHAGHAELFDQVVFASHADDSLAMLADATPAERELLGAFGFQDNHAVLHSDTALMPRRRAVWSSWNYLTEDDGISGQRVAVTYWMNRLQRIPGDRTYLVSLNPLHEPDPATVIKRMDYRHPVFDRAAVAAQERLGEIQGRDRVWFCGAWCGYGFHEDGLAAGEAVARGLGVTPPWEARVG